MTGKEKKTDTKKPKFNKIYKTSLTLALSNANKKFPFTYLPNKQYPILPTIK